MRWEVWAKFRDGRWTMLAQVYQRAAAELRRKQAVDARRFDEVTIRTIEER